MFPPLVDEVDWAANVDRDSDVVLYDKCGQWDLLRLRESEMQSGGLMKKGGKGGSIKKKNEKRK